MKITLSNKHLKKLDKDSASWLSQFLGKEFEIMRNREKGLWLKGKDNSVDLTQFPILENKILGELYPEEYTLIGSSGGYLHCQMYKDRHIHTPHIVYGKGYRTRQHGYVNRICGGIENLNRWVLSDYTPGDVCSLSVYKWREISSEEEEG